jgi:hypothetical protein
MKPIQIVLAAAIGLVSPAHPNAHAAPQAPSAAIESFPLRCPKLTVTVTSADELKNALESDFEGTILIPRGTRIDLKDYRRLPVKSCVTLKGTRQGLDRGAVLFTNVKSLEPEDSDEDPMTPVFRVLNAKNVRIEGLRFRGPAPTSHRAETPGVDAAIQVVGDVANVVIDNNDFWYWNAAVSVAYTPSWTTSDPPAVAVTRNYFHRNGNDRLGYGIVTGQDGYASIEGNLFTHNRHAIASVGSGDVGYIARHNYVLEGGFTQGGAFSYWNQHFDVHGTGGGGYGGRAGKYFDISFNTFRGEQTYGLGETRAAFLLRGKPEDGAWFENNVLVHDDAGKAVRLKNPGLQCCEAYVGFACVRYSNELCNLHVGPNAYDVSTTDQLAVGDFDGDGRDDVFLANGTAWWYSSAGLTEWRYLRPSTLGASAVRIGRFDSDDRADVLFTQGGKWWLSSGGSGTPQAMRDDTTALADCLFGDFNHDGRTDALAANGLAWSVWFDISDRWMVRRESPIRATSLRAADFNGDGFDDVFWIENDVWHVFNLRRNRVTRDHRKPVQGVAIDSLVVADFDGNGLADLAQTEGDGWRWLAGGTTEWAPLRGPGGQPEYSDVRKALLGRFGAGDRRTDAIRYASSAFPYAYKQAFVIWNATQDPFAPWSPPLQEMR